LCRGSKFVLPATFSSCRLGGSCSYLLAILKRTLLFFLFYIYFLTVQEVRAHVSQAVAEQNKQQPTRSIGPMQNLSNLNFLTKSQSHLTNKGNSLLAIKKLTFLFWPPRKLNFLFSHQFYFTFSFDHFH
jgi:hypothetical protein